MHWISSIILMCNLVAMLLLSEAHCGLTTLKFGMDESGMHRKLEYTVQFTKALLGRNCKYIILQSLPTAVYISTDELDDLQRLQKLSAVYPKFVDVEIVTEKAKPFSVLLRGSPKLEETLTLPIHFRYHQSSYNRTKATVKISTPELYLSCLTEDSEPIDPQLLVEPYKLYCLNEHIVNFEQLISRVAPKECNWQKIRVDNEITDPLQTEIPVGNANAYIIVLYATIALSWALALWTILNTLSFPRRINRELYEKVKVR